MPLPAQVTTFSGNVRGYWFTAPTCFTITGLEVPTDASAGVQNIAVVRFNAPPPVYATTTNDFTVLYLTQNNAATGMIPVTIQVSSGEIIGILGNRADNNSYATSPASSDINGVPVTLTRLGMQFNLSTTAPQDLWTEASGNISRVWMYYDTTFTANVTQNWQGGTSYSFDNGAGPLATSVWDYGDGSPLDTAYNPTHVFAAPGNYNVCSYITGSCFSDTACTTVIICPAPALADYTYSTTYPTVNFTDASQNAANWSWDFGDGSPLNTQQNPSHAYATFGLYTVCLTVTDTCGGVQTHCENISVCPALLPISLGSDVTACGSTIISLPGYSTYNWNTSETTAQITVTGSGDYSVVVTDAAGCSGTDTVNVTINPLPVVNLGNDSTQCAGSIVLDAQNAGNSFIWSNGATTQTIPVSVSGTYAVTVTDGLGCTNTDDVVITINPLPSVNLGNDITICQGFVSISAGNGAASYIWNTGSTLSSILVNSSGAYSVVVTSSLGCTATDTIVITMIAPAVTYVETQTALCINGSPITLTPGTPSGGTYSGPGVTGNQFDPAAAGLGNKNVIYSFTDTITGCIGRDTSVINVSTCSGLNVLSQEILNIYPNPGTGLFTVNLARIADEIYVTDIYGKLVTTIRPLSTTVIVDLTSKAEGVYLLKAVVNGSEHTFPLMIKQ